MGIFQQNSNNHFRQEICLCTPRAAARGSRPVYIPSHSNRPFSASKQSYFLGAAVVKQNFPVCQLKYLAPCSMEEQDKIIVDNKNTEKMLRN